MSGLLKQILDWAKTIVVAFVLAMVINTFVVQTYKVQGESMLPTIEHNDRTIVFKMVDEYDYGDIVVIDSRVDKERTLKDDLLENPLTMLLTQAEDHHLWIKRVIGKPNDKLEFKNNELYRNGERVEERYILEHMRKVPDMAVTVPPDHIFVMGDNRNHSVDSRNIGSIPLSNVLGKVLFK
jgi:signal peptidase I